ncbi:dihydrofolate reductase [Treponema sp. C6A8]|uniref:dihydrofolate reductase n=1 Tax=Treponema sp. C6A8 TaxID=1410609 RepID=UPI0006884074|nr:dihydrofolate reductase [Treponema sp. C6A8]
MKVAIVVAFEKNRGIGNKGRIVWDFPSDRAYYKTLTLGNFVIFGRRTFEEFGRALPGRINIVVSSTKKFEGENLYTVKNLEAAIELAEKINSTNEILPARPQFLLPNPAIFICGGQNIYREGISLAQTIYTTQIDADYACDAFFPELPNESFKIENESSTLEKGVKLSFITYSR